MWVQETRVGCSSRDRRTLGYEGQAARAEGTHEGEVSTGPTLQIPSNCLLINSKFRCMKTSLLDSTLSIRVF